jgi:hypothetical protein
VSCRGLAGREEIPLGRIPLRGRDYTVIVNEARPHLLPAASPDALRANADNIEAVLDGVRASVRAYHGRYQPAWRFTGDSGKHPL